MLGVTTQDMTGQDGTGEDGAGQGMETLDCIGRMALQHIPLHYIALPTSNLSVCLHGCVYAYACNVYACAYVVVCMYVMYINIYLVYTHVNVIDCFPHT